jgi:thymidylate synthase
MIHKKDNMNIDEQYLTIAKSILERGTEKNDRTGTGTKSIFSAQVVHDMKEGFPLLTTKKVFFKGIVSELLWFLRGETNIKWLVENNNNIWVGDAYKFYLEHYVDEYNEELEKKNEGLGWMAQELVNIRPLSKEQFIEKIKTDDEFANKWGELGPVYGAGWRNWGGEFSEHHSDRKGGTGRHFKGIDQISQAIHTLKTNPDSRRIIVNAWNVGELDNMTLPPCHWAFELYTEETDLGKRRLSLKWHQRSCDFFLGVPFNIASYALLLEILSKEVNMVPGTLVGDLTNVHIYNNHIEQMEEQISRDPHKHKYPKLVINDGLIFGEGIDKFLDSCKKTTDFRVDGYDSYPQIKGELSN